MSYFACNQITFIFFQRIRFYAQKNRFDKICKNKNNKAKVSSGEAGDAIIHEYQNISPKLTRSRI